MHGAAMRRGTRDMRRWRGLLVAVLALAGWMVAPAVRAANCSVNATALNFGAYDPLLAAPDDAGPITITVDCSNLGRTAVQARVSLSRGSSPTFFPRRMQRTAAPLQNLGYNIYTTAARTTVWGDGTGGTPAPPMRNIVVNDCVFFVFCFGSEQFMGFGRIPAGQDVRTGSYLDQIQVTVEF